MTKKIILGFSTILLLLQILFTAYFGYLDYMELQTTLSNSLISNRAVSLIFRDHSAPPLSELVECYPDLTFFSQLADLDDLNLWGLSGACELDQTIIDMMDGSFFTKDDFFNGKKKAIVGQNIVDSKQCFLDSSQKRWFQHGNNNYEVIGVLSPSINSMLDNTVFINLDSINETAPNTLTLDAAESDAVTTAFTVIEQKYSVDPLYKNDNFVERYLMNDVDKQILRLFITIFIAILVIVLSMFLLRYYHEEVSVKRIIGVRFKLILFDLFKSILVLSLATTGVFLSIYTIVYVNVLQKIPLNFHFLPALAFSGAIFVAISIIIYLYMLLSTNLFYRNGVK